MFLSGLGWFAGGVLFGTAGIAALKSKEAKNVYVRAIAAGLRCKDALVKNGTAVKESFDDLCAEAEDINEVRQAELDAKKLEEARALLAEAEAAVAEAEAAVNTEE